MKYLRSVLLTAAILLISIGLTRSQSPHPSMPMPAHPPMHPTTGDSTNVGDSLKPKPPLYDAADTVFAPDDYVVIESHHRMFPDFLQTDTVKFHQRFQLGDEPIYAVPFVFVPDLKITMKGEKIKTSDTLNNPAVELRVFLTDTTTQKDSLLQESWAFYYGGAPHFARNAFFAFTVKDFKVSNPRYIRPPERK